MKQLKIDYEAKLKRILEDSYVNPKGVIQKPPIAISFGYTNSNNPEPIGIASYGNFSFVQAPPKVRKRSTSL